jgi:NADH-quinone oxidoreductase subunit J
VPLDNVVFWVFAPIAVAAAVGMLVTRSVVYAALFLVVNLGCIAVMYLVLDAAFLFAVQIEVRSERLWLQRPIAIVLAIGFMLEVGAAIRAGVGFATHAPDGFDVLQPAGNAQAVAESLFHNYFFPFEATSILLIVAAIAAMVLAQRKVRAVTQAELGAELEDEREDVEATP